ncbi:MAG: hypothetical protein K2O03_03610 [Lachnospiraceae bacterium]|nr:hypothetical protein [Lachnospiraceae bacterium]
MKFFHVDKRRLVLVVVSVILMGFFLSFLKPCGFGTDPCTVMNLAISGKIGWTLGNWQAALNCILFVFVVWLGRDQIGWGTIANMFLVGYSFDFFTMVNSFWLPEDAFETMAVRIAVAAVTLLGFVVAVSAYMACDLGTSPYDAVAFLIASRQKKLPFRVVRILYDALVCLVAVLFGTRLGVITIAMALLIGPVVTWMKENVVEKYLPLKK